MSGRFAAGALVAASVIACLLAIVDAPPAIRLPFGLVALLAPGWLLLLGGANALAKPAVERAIVAAGVSLAVTVLLGLLLVVSGIGVTAVSVCAALLLVNAALAHGPSRRNGPVRALPSRRSVGVAAASGMFAVVVAVVTLGLAPASPSAADGPLAIGLQVHGGSDGSPRVDVELTDRRGQAVQVIARLAGQDGNGRRFGQVIARWTIRGQAGVRPWRATVAPPANLPAQRLTVVVTRLRQGGLAAGPPLRETSVSL